MENINNIDATHEFILVLRGGSLGSITNATTKIWMDGNWYQGVKTGNDLAALKEEKSRRNKNLTPGEKSYYSMKYLLRKITPGISKQLNNPVTH